MGFFDAAKATVKGNKAYQMHAAANKLTDEGKVSEARSRYTEALKLYAEAVEAGCNRANILQGYAILLMREGELEKAREIMLKIEKIKGLTANDWFHLRLNYSIYQWKTGKLDKAIETIRRAAGDKMNSAVYTTLGMFLVDEARETRDFEKALAFNMEALEYDDEDAATLDNLGQLYLAMETAEADRDKAKEYRDKARKYFEKAHEEKPRQITTIYYLARMYHEDGEDERAREVLKDVDTIYFSAICPVSRQDMRALSAEVGV